MRLVVDANILVAQLLRHPGRELVANDELELFIAQAVWEEAQHELRRRSEAIADQGRLSEATVTALLDAAIEVAERCVTIVPHEEYADTEDRARRRIPRDPDDWPTVGLGLLLDAAIWTQDNDFLGCGVPTWTTDTLKRHLDAQG